MAEFPHVWICAYSEVVRADRVTSFFVSDEGPDLRAAESTSSGALWAYVLGRHEPVRIDGFSGIAVVDLLTAVTQAIEKALDRRAYVSYIRLSSTTGPAPVTSVQIYDSYPPMG
ncbi:hypothetical protein [Streptosporangium jomthongense]|uniref:Uncharacterized protein n=1 Tax=Streptosporangium jomthongense TaxID=1193683 RepID=A0ABV8F937_9ACTN